MSRPFASQLLWLFRSATCLFVLALSWLSGCSNIIPELVPFGAVNAPDHFRSLNGLGIHRRMWESTGAKVLTPQKLSPMLDSMDVIVLVGQSFDPPGKAARDWLENWLAAKSGRTVIYFGRDFNADVYYRQQTLDDLEGEDRLRGEQLLAMTAANELSGLIREVPENTFCGWFYLETEQAPRNIDKFAGQWSRGLGDVTGPDAGGTWPVRTWLLPPRMTYKNRRPSWIVNKTPKPVNQNPLTELEGSNVQRSEWELDELDTQEKWNAEFENLLESDVFLSSEDGTPLVFRLTHPQRLRGSQILVVANGAPFLNGTLVQPLHQRVAEKLIETALPAERVALMAYDQLGMLISKAPEGDARGLGLEMLTTWPLSAITMPAALLGIVACAALWPILGRPRKPRPRSVSDFGLHVEAVGRMLQESRDALFAKNIVTEYFRKVREESPPPWLEQMTVPNETQVAAAPTASSATASSATADGPTTAAALPPPAAESLVAAPPVTPSPTDALPTPTSQATTPGNAPPPTPTSPPPLTQDARGEQNP